VAVVDHKMPVYVLIQMVALVVSVAVVVVAAVVK
jgi:hypothetical protein